MSPVAPIAGFFYADYELSLASKALGQIELVRQGLSSVSEAASFSLITGILSTHPVVTSSAAAAANGAVEAFVRAAALEIAPRRINAACPSHGPGVFVLFDRLFLMSGSCVSVKSEDALVVAAVVATGVGGVGEPSAAESAGVQVADGGVGVGLVPGADLLEVFGECLVAHVVDWASHCSFTAWGWLEQPALGGG